MWKTSDPVVREWIQRNLGPIGALEGAAQGAGEIGRFLADVPSLLTRAGTVLEQMDEATRDGLVLSPDTIERIGAAEARRNRPTAIALWVIAALLVAITWMLV
jgi:ubiquinone biosynthesis protein